LQGARGLWIFEALSAKPLWKRETGGLKSNRELAASIQAIQALLPPRTPELVSVEVSWERAIQDFLDRRSPLLVTSLDALPAIARKAPFRWKSALLPAIPSTAPGASSSLLTANGTELIVTRDHPEVWNFLRYLYSKEIAPRWCIPAGYLPLRPDWQKAKEWRQAPEAYREVALAASKAFAKNSRHRSTDTQVVRAHSEWISALHYLFGDTAKRLPTETVFTQLDSTLSP
jgi:ABC-type glycerol-3-phosphate transport system substrate-binding protein